MFVFLPVYVCEKKTKCTLIKHFKLCIPISCNTTFCHKNETNKERREVKNSNREKHGEKMVFCNLF